MRRTPLTFHVKRQRTRSLHKPRLNAYWRQLGGEVVITSAAADVDARRETCGRETDSMYWIAACRRCRPPATSACASRETLWESTRWCEPVHCPFRHSATVDDILDVRKRAAVGVRAGASRNPVPRRTYFRIFVSERLCPLRFTCNEEPQRRVNRRFQRSLPGAEDSEARDAAHTLPGYVSR